MIRTISIASVSAIGLAAVAACASLAPPPPAPVATCEALRPDMPVKYHGNTTDPVTIGNIRRANARFEAACGKAGA